MEEATTPCPEGQSVAMESSLWFWLHVVPCLLSPWFFSSSFTCGEAASYLGSPSGVFVIQDARHILLALGNPKKVESQWGLHSVGWSHEPNRKINMGWEPASPLSASRWPMQWEGLPLADMTPHSIIHHGLYP